MMFFYTGGSKSGKSMLAQRKARELAGAGPLYYLATMEPKDDEDRSRIARHLKERDGWGFETIECGKSLLSCLEKADRRGVFLLDSVTALLSNEMFRDAEVCFGAAKKVATELLTLAGSVRALVAVSDDIYSDGCGYDYLTEEFRRGLSYICKALAAKADCTIEISAGQAAELNGKEPKTEGGSAVTLIIGGAYQGKTEYAKSRFGLADEDIFECGTTAPDCSRRCLCHLERLSLFCDENGLDARALLDNWLKAQPEGVLICDDIFCGVVPMEQKTRAWRESAGLLLRFAAERSGEVTRIVCGLPQRLK